jgi:hypothetical protein
MKPWQALHRTSTDFEQFHASHIISSWMTSHSYWSNWSDRETNFPIFPSSYTISLEWFNVDNWSYRSLHDARNTVTDQVTGAIHILMFAVWQTDNSELYVRVRPYYVAVSSQKEEMLRVFKWLAQAGGSIRNKKCNKTACNGEEVPPLNSLLAYETRSSEMN